MDSNTPNPPNKTPRSTESQDKSTWSVVDEDDEINAPMTEDDTSNIINQTAGGPPNEINLNNSNNDHAQYPGSRSQTKSKTNDQICRFYIKGKCKYGLKGRDCQFIHPKPCTKLLKYGNKQPRGCNLGTKCQSFHPRMCSSSITRGECFNLDCKFTHVKGTKRHQKKQNNRNDEPQDFLAILDNFDTEIIL